MKKSKKTLLNTGFKIAPWCSTNIYRTKNETRAYICNEANDCYLLLEDISAELWDLILNNKSYDELLKFSEQNDETKETLDDFLTQLQAEDLIVSSNNVKPKFFNIINNKHINYSFETSCEKQEDFIEEMNNWTQKNKFLVQLHIELTYKCNQRCIHCFNHKNMPQYELSFEDVKKIIDEAYELGLFTVNISGGESTCSKDFLKIIKYIRQKHIHLNLLTNGQLLYDNKEFFDTVTKIYPAKVSLTLFSMNPETHDKITQVKGSQVKVISVIKKLLENHIYTEVKIFLTKYNAMDFVDIMKFAKENNVHSCFFDERFFNNPENANEDVEVTDEQLYEIYKTFNKEFSVIPPKVIDISDSEHKKYTPCRAGHISLVINPDLNVSVCVFIQISVGNLKQNTLREIWFEKNKDTNKNLHNWRKVTLASCKECYNEEYCRFCSYCAGFAEEFLKPAKNLCRRAKAIHRIYTESLK